ncbi:CBU_0592 family membrane protein [Okibacterium fritillariae]|uniref:CBU_0592 family membrane protein n=1 Tax=Okibacterium fritillariae TaxID=123320 RepID=UPI0040555E15
MDSSLLLTLAGWLGALGTVTAYALLTFGKLTSTSALFQSLNIAGAALLCVSATVSQAWPSAAVNAVWIVIGLQAIVPLVKRLTGRNSAAVAGAATARAATARTVAAGVTTADTTYDAHAWDDYTATERELARTEMPPTLVLPVIRDSGYVLDERYAAA